MTENARVKELRKSKSLTLEEFGSKIGLGRTAISRIERGERGLTNQNRLAICREFGVSEEWLRTGAGEMYIQRTGEEEIADAVEKLMGAESSAFRRRLVTVLSRLSEDEWEILEKRMEEIVCARAAPPEADPMQEIEAKVEAYRQRLLAEKMGAPSSGYSRDPGSPDSAANTAIDTISA